VNKIGSEHRIRETAVQQIIGRSTFPHVKLQGQYSKRELQSEFCPEAIIQQPPISHAENPESTIEMIEHFVVKRCM
jgi:hypothetical protein